MDPATFLTSSIILINNKNNSYSTASFYIPYVVAAPVGFICPIVSTASLQKEKSQKKRKMPDYPIVGHFPSFKGALLPLCDADDGVSQRSSFIHR